MHASSHCTLLCKINICDPGKYKPRLQAKIRCLVCIKYSKRGHAALLEFRLFLLNDRKLSEFLLKVFQVVKKSKCVLFSNVRKTEGGLNDAQMHNNKFVRGDTITQLIVINSV